jgi:ubiquinone/menaquinone biosynthesis C-methylase UbiE
MLASLRIGRADTVIELAPGLGHTAERVIELQPSSYLGVDREEGVVKRLNATLARDGVRFVTGTAEDTGLPGEIASVLYGEAMLTMQPHARRKVIVDEAWRLLQRGGRYGIHELCVRDMGETDRRLLEAELAQVIHHGVRLLTVLEWRNLLESAGFQVNHEMRAPMKLLEPRRIVHDEGVAGATRFAANLVCHPGIMRRVLGMRACFRRHQHHLEAISLVCKKDY